MQKFKTIVVLTLTAFSLLEIFSNSHKVEEAHSEEDHDAFSEFDDPADQYTSEHEEVEQLEIRESTGSGSEAAKSSFVPPIDMPPIRFAFCVSCGYRNAFEQYSTLIKDKYPGVNIEGSNYTPSYPKAFGAQIIGLSKIAVIVIVVTGRDPFPSFGFQTPSVYTWMLSNKLSSCMMLFIFSNSIENMLMSTGAFEIYVGDELIWSKLESGRVPSPAELVQGIDGYLALHGGKSSTDFGFKAT